MKKFFIPLCVCLFLTSSFIMAQAADDDENVDPTKIEVIEEQLERATVLRIEYTPVTDEARITYTCSSPLFDQGAAMNVIKTRVTAFLKEKGYFSYQYIRQDVTSYDNVKRTTSYTSFFHFSR